MNDAAPAPAVPRTCPRCHAAIPAGAPPGVCPQCELQGALDVWTAPPLDTSAGVEASPIEELGASPRQFGDYELLEEIARGGMGVVYRARQRSLDRIVAVKMLLSGPLASREFIQRFRTEAAAAASLQHPNIVTIHEVGFHDGQHFFAMDFVAGRTLADIISGQPIPPQRAAGYLKTVAQAVHHAHEHGILHRDLKPSNVMIDAEDQPRITDFGLAKRVSGDTEATLSAQTLGSPSYMPPEQVATDLGKVSRRSDVFALGAMLYHALTGRPPFVGGTLAETLRALLDTEPVSPRLLNPSVPADLETICLKCLEKDSARRYGSAQALADELGRFLKCEPILARPISRVERAGRWCQRQPALAASAAIILVLLAVVAVGSTVVAIRLKRQERDLQTALRGAYQSEAHLRRESGQVGQRFDSLMGVARAATLGASLALRNEAIAALALPDLREVRRLARRPGHSLGFDAALTTVVEAPTADAPGREAIIRRLEDGAEIARVRLLEGTGAFGLSPDGRFLTMHRGESARPARVRIWNIMAGATVFEEDVPARGWPVDYHPAGQHAALGQADGNISMVDLRERSIVGQTRIGFPVNRLRFHPQSQRLAAARFGHPEVVVLEWPGGEVVAHLIPAGPVTGSLDWSAEGNLLAVGCTEASGNEVVQMWEWRGDQIVPGFTLHGHQAPVMSTHFIPGSDLLLTSAYEPSSRLWSITTGRELLRSPHALVMDNVAGRGLLFEAEAEAFIHYEIVDGPEYRLLRGPRMAPVHTSVDFSPRAPLVASAAADGVRLWLLPDGKPLGVLSVGSSQSARFHPRDGSLFVAADHRVTRWPMEFSAGGETLTVGPPEIITLPKPRGWDLEIAVAADGSRLAATAAIGAEVLDLANSKESQAVVCDAAASAVALSPGGSCLVTCGGDLFRVWELPSGRLVRELPGAGYSGASFSLDGRWAVLSCRAPGGNMGVHRLYRVEGWQLEREFGASNVVWNVSAFSPDSRLLAVRSSGSGVRLLDTRDWSELATFDVPEQQMIFDLAFSADSTRLGIACETRLVQVWDLRAVRQSLARLGLDWDLPPYSPAPPDADIVPRLVIER